MISKNQLARVVGTLYLVLAVRGGFSQLYVRSSVQVAGDATATAENIRASATLFRVAFMTDLVNTACFILLALALARQQENRFGVRHLQRDHRRRYERIHA